LEGNEKETRIVIDTNILMAALINPTSSVWFLLETKAIKFLAPEFFLLELKKYLELIKEKLNKKSALDSFNLLISNLFKNIIIIPEEFYFDMFPVAIDLMKNIDEKDSPFLALALKLKCAILSNDEHFKKQNEVKCYNIDEFINIFFQKTPKE
jgi:predicted nucleic acid-binding protein